MSLKDIIHDFHTKLKNINEYSRDDDKIVQKIIGILNKNIDSVIQVPNADSSGSMSPAPEVSDDTLDTEGVDVAYYQIHMSIMYRIYNTLNAHEPWVTPYMIIYSKTVPPCCKDFIFLDKEYDKGSALAKLKTLFNAVYTKTAGSFFDRRKILKTDVIEDIKSSRLSDTYDMNLVSFEDILLAFNIDDTVEYTITDKDKKKAAIIISDKMRLLIRCLEQMTDTHI